MQSERSFDMLVRKVMDDSDTEDSYRVTFLQKIESMEDILMHPTISDLIGDRFVRIEKIDSYRYRLLISK